MANFDFSFEQEKMTIKQLIELIEEKHPLKEYVSTGELRSFLLDRRPLELILLASQVLK